MIEKNIDKLLVKYFSKEASESELLELQKWASQNSIAFKKAVKLNLEVQKRRMPLLEVEKAFDLVKMQCDTTKVIPLKTPRKWKPLLRYAALLIAVCSVGTFYLLNNVNISSENSLADTSKEIKLELADGSVKIITEGVEQEIRNNKGEIVSTQKEDVLKYNAPVSKIVKEQEIYNSLSIPLGKIFKLVLSDGTKVVLNAGSTLRYPTRFLNAGSRQVYLDGEGYFEVTKNTASPFVVTTDKHCVRVLGTHFNVNSYSEDNNMQTVLVEGAVGIYSNKKAFKENDMLLLKPQQKATWEPESNQITVVPANTAQYTAWVGGTLMFVNTSFLEMVKKIERHYNVSIQNNYPALEDHVFTATFEHETIDQVMRAIQLYSHFDYKINNNQIIINQTLNQTKPMTK